MDEEAGGAEQAFRDLASEVAITRRKVEALPKALKVIGTDYTPTLLEVTKALTAVGQHLQAIEQHPALRSTPQQHRAAIAAAGESVMHDALQHLHRATAEVHNERHHLAVMIGTMRGQDAQWWWLCWIGLAGLILGFVFTPMVAALLPFGLDSREAALIMQADRWDAGRALMAAQNARGLADLDAAGELVAQNKAAIDACRDAAAKLKREQHCSVVVPAP